MGRERDRAAVVGAVDAGGGVANGNQRQPHAKSITHAPVAPLWSENPEREPVPLARDAERALPHARRPEHRTSHARGTGAVAQV
jgi:hypothetical protein